jgi:hypothetical protein
MLSAISCSQESPANKSKRRQRTGSPHVKGISLIQNLGSLKTVGADATVVFM